jgi:hypothetical protein
MVLGIIIVIVWVLKTLIIYRCYVSHAIRNKQMQKIENVAPEIRSCKECGILMIGNSYVEYCNRCLDPYYLEEHHGG